MIRKESSPSWIKYMESKRQYKNMFKIIKRIQYDENRFNRKEKFYDFANDCKEQRNKDFMFCCDLLKLKEYKEFEKKVKFKYFNLDNFRLVRETIDSNNVEHFKYILDYVNIQNMEEVLLYCCKHGFNNIVDYILDNNKQFNKYNLYMEYSSMNSLYLVKKYRKIYKDINLNVRVINNTVATNNMENIKWLMENNYNFNFTTLNYAIGTNNLEIIKFVRKNNKNRCYTNNIYSCGVSTGNITIMNWIYKQKSKPGEQGFDLIQNYRAYESATEENNMEMLNWLYDHNCCRHQYDRNITIDNNDFRNKRVMREIYINAMKHKNIKMLNWLYDRGFKIYFIGWLYDRLFKINSLEVFQWLYYKNFKIDYNNIINLADENTNPQIVEFMRKIIKEKNLREERERSQRMGNVIYEEYFEQKEIEEQTNKVICKHLPQKSKGYLHFVYDNPIKCIVVCIAGVLYIIS